jgi:hypothetical protein
VKLTIRGRSGSLHQFVRKKKNIKGQIVEYPKVNGPRNPKNVNHWEWQLSWKEKIDDRWITGSLRVPPAKANKVEQMILATLDITEIQAFIKG